MYIQTEAVRHYSNKNCHSAFFYANFHKLQIYEFFQKNKGFFLSIDSFKQKRAQVVFLFTLLYFSICEEIRLANAAPSLRIFLNIHKFLNEPVGNANP